jgi:hypothetical protein
MIRRTNFKYVWIVFVFMLFAAGCSETVLTPQNYVGVQVKDAVQIKQVVEVFALKNGFTDKLNYGNTKHFAKSGQFQLSFNRGSDNSFIVIGNILQKNCVRISVYSSIGVEDSKVILDSLIDGFGSQFTGDFNVFPDVDCEFRL